VLWVELERATVSCSWSWYTERSLTKLQSHTSCEQLFIIKKKSYKFWLNLITLKYLYKTIQLNHNVSVVSSLTILTKYSYQCVFSCLFNFSYSFNLVNLNSSILVLVLIWAANFCHTFRFADDNLPNFHRNCHSVKNLFIFVISMPLFVTVMVDGNNTGSYTLTIYHKYTRAKILHTNHLTSVCIN